jgi:quercetin dioxygenase-like cupin family protein
MSTHIQLLSTPHIHAVIYVFDEMGEGLGEHYHDYTTAHDIRVLQGSVVIQGDIPRKILNVGEVYNFDWTKNHAIIALEDGTAIMNTFINGIPEQYRNLPPEKRFGIAEDTLHNRIAY